MRALIDQRQRAVVRRLAVVPPRDGIGPRPTSGRYHLAGRPGANSPHTRHPARMSSDATLGGRSMARTGEYIRATLKRHPKLKTAARHLSGASALLAHRLGSYTGPFYPHDGNTDHEHRRRLEWVLDRLDPISTPRQSMIRVGGQSDGGYVMASLIGPSQVAASVGIGDNDDWEAELAERGVRTSQFDHTIADPPSFDPRMRFHRLGLADRSAAATHPKLVDMSAMVDACRNDWGVLPSILKMDIEGAEWSVLADVAADQLDQFEQILIELHGLHKRSTQAKWEESRSAIHRLTESHAPIHVHPNNSWPLLDVAGLPVPHTLEVTLLRRDLVSPEDSPTEKELDRPCVIDRPETRLWTFKSIS